MVVAEPRVQLRSLTVADQQMALVAHRELAPEGFQFLLNFDEHEPWQDYVERTSRIAHGLDLPPEWVPATFLVAEADGELVGRVSIRHELNAYLAQFGGHIGYGVRPRFRGRGYATAILRQAVVVAHDVGVDNVLLTCDVDNVASAKVIARCGGTLECVVTDDETGVAKRRYWIRADG